MGDILMDKYGGPSAKFIIWHNFINTSFEVICTYLYVNYEIHNHIIS